VQYFLEICRFAIRGLIIKISWFSFCGLAYLRNLRICNCGMSPRICGFGICGHLKNVCLPTSDGERRQREYTPLQEVETKEKTQRRPFLYSSSLLFELRVKGRGGSHGVMFNQFKYNHFSETNIFSWFSPFKMYLVGFSLCYCWKQSWGHRKLP
jgi:hypothetical protein